MICICFNVIVFFDEPKRSVLWVSFVSYIFLSGQTPLHLFVRIGYLEICRLLLQSNADVQAKTCR